MPKYTIKLLILCLALASCGSKKGKNMVSGADTSRPSQTQPYLKSCDRLETYQEQLDCSKNAITMHLQNNLDYPTTARKVGLQGTVIIKAFIDIHGKVSETSLEQGVAPMLNKEAMRVIESLPEFVPASKNNIPSPSWVTFPVVFELK